MLLFSIILATFMYIVMMVMNMLANTLPLNGITTGDVSFKYPNLFQPSGMTFSIWGIIYLLLFAFVIYQYTYLGKSMTLESRDLLIKINVLFAFSSLFNALWLIAWHYDRIMLSTIIMIMLLITLIFISKLTVGLTVLERTTFSVYLGWITVATIANVTIMLVKLGISSMDQRAVMLTSIILIIGLVISILWIIREKDVAYGLVIVWAYIGILMRHMSTSGLNRIYPLIYITTIISLVVLVSVLGFILTKHTLTT